MRRQLNLRQRIIVAFLLLTLVVTSGFAVGIFFIIHDQEASIFARILNRQAAWLIETHSHEPLPIVHRQGDITLYGVPERTLGPVPAEIASLPPGFHELRLGDTVIHLIKAHRDGRDYYVLFNQPELAHLHPFYAALFSMALMMLLALWIGGATANWVIAPVIRLAHDVLRTEGAAQDQILQPKYSDDEVGLLASAFDRKISRLGDFLERERLFTGDVSHELRTWLMIILGAAEVVSARHPEGPTQAAAQRIQRAALQMQELATAFLALSREQQGQGAATSPVRLAGIVETAIEDHRNLLDTKPVTVRVEHRADGLVAAPRELLAIVIGNLVRNAFQYTREGSVDIIVDAQEFQIIDTGPGVPEAARQTIFERHERAAPAGTEGSGLGLAIVRRVSEHFGWTVAFEENQPNGSRFRLTFPPVDQNTERMFNAPSRLNADLTRT